MRRTTRPLNKTRRKCRTRKIRFPSQFEAETALTHHDEPEKEVHPNRAYECPLCHGWHLTKAAFRLFGEAMAHTCCGANVGDKHELHCETVSPEEYFARTGGRLPRQKEGS